MTARARLRLRQKVSSGDVASISIVKELQFNARMVQLWCENVIPFGGGEPADEDFVLKKTNSDEFNIVLYKWNFYERGGNELWATEPFEFMRGDSIKIEYPNSADYDVRVEAIFKEID